MRVMNRVFGLALSLNLSFLSCVAVAHSEPSLDQLRVLELMRQETEKLMSTNIAQKAVANQLTEAPHLKAIYGVGRRLLAEVQWQGQDYLYLRGQAWPLGHTQQQLRLVELAGRCITLAHQDQTYHLCMKIAGGE